MSYVKTPPQDALSHPKPFEDDRPNTPKQNTRLSDQGPAAPKDPSLVHRIQANLDRFMEMQGANQRLMERFLDMQEQLMAVALNGAADLHGQNPAPAERLSGLKPEERTPSPPPLKRPPAPVLPKLTAVLPEKLAPPVVENKPAEIRPVTELPAPKRPLTLPTATQFQADLLRTVSELTGYPEEMLGMDAHLEADLGIDSIKRVEIFSLLGEHHTLLEAHDAGAVLEELANLDTLQKIVDWYQTNLARMQEAETLTAKKQ